MVLPEKLITQVCGYLIRLIINALLLDVQHAVGFLQIQLLTSSSELDIFKLKDNRRHAT